MLSLFLGWLGVPPPGLTWCPRSLADLVSRLLGWLSVPTPVLTLCRCSFGRLCDNLLSTWWPHPFLAHLMMATPVVDCLMTIFRLGDTNTFGCLCDNHLSTWRRQSPSVYLSDHNPRPVYLVAATPSVDCLTTSCRLGDDCPFLGDLVTTLNCCWLADSNPCGRLCDNLVSIWWRQPPWVDCVMPPCRLGDNNPCRSTVWYSQIVLATTFLVVSTWWRQTPLGGCVMTFSPPADNIPIRQLCFFGLTWCPLPPWVDLVSPVLQSLGGMYVNLRPCVKVWWTTAYYIDCALRLTFL